VGMKFLNFQHSSRLFSLDCIEVLLTYYWVHQGAVMAAIVW